MHDWSCLVNVDRIKNKTGYSAVSKLNVHLIMIILSGAPTIELRESLECAETHDVNILAKIQGCPFPSLVWQKATCDKPDEKCDVQYDLHINKLVSDDKCSLVIQQSKRDDSGIYTLTATNSLGKASKDIKLTILGMFFFFLINIF